MSFRLFTPKIVALTLAGFLITMLFIKGFVEAWQHGLRASAWYLIVAAALTFIYFRHRKIAFAITVCSVLLVNVGMTAIFHPTGAGLLITFASALGLYGISVWIEKKYPNYSRKVWIALFDHDPDP